VSAPGCDAVLFDLFDTLVLFQRDRLPEIHVNGRTMRSTAALVHGALRPASATPRIARWRRPSASA
jgi:hypothetical protein